jgi:hypothetical protein
MLDPYEVIDNDEVEVTDEPTCPVCGIEVGTPGICSTLCVQIHKADSDEDNY